MIPSPTQNQIRHNVMNLQFLFDLNLKSFAVFVELQKSKLGPVDKRNNKHDLRTFNPGL